MCNANDPHHPYYYYCYSIGGATSGYDCLPWPVKVFTNRGDYIRIRAGRRPFGSLSSEVGIELVSLLDRARIDDLYVRAEGLEGDTMLRQQGLVLPKAIDEVTLWDTLLPPPRRLGRHDATFDADFDTIGTRLLLVTSHLALLAEHTAVATSDFDNGGVRIWWGIGDGGAGRGGLVVD